MGWICSWAADGKLQRIAKACAATRPADDKSSNVYYVGQRRYFYEVTRRDQNDNGIVGTIHLCLPDNMARQVGTFRIDTFGKVTRGPRLFREA